MAKKTRYFWSVFLVQKIGFGQFGLNLLRPYYESKGIFKLKLNEAEKFQSLKILSLNLPKKSLKNKKIFVKGQKFKIDKSFILVKIYIKIVSYGGNFEVNV